MGEASTTLRKAADNRLHIHLTFQDRPAAQAELFVLPWSAKTQSRAFSMEGLSRSYIFREAQHLVADASGECACDSSSDTIFVAARCPGSAPFGRKLEFPVDGLITLDLPPEEHLRGRVIHEVETAIIQATVFAERAFQTEFSLDRVVEDDQRIAGMFFSSSVTTAPDGSFDVGGLPAGRVFVVATAEGASSHQHDEYQLPKKDPIILLLRASRTLRGKVVDRSTQRGIEGARIASFIPHSEVTITETVVTSSDAEGRFTLVGVEEGAESVSLRLVRKGYAATLEILGKDALRSGKEAVVAMEPACTVRGIVRAKDGKGLKDVWVQVHDDETLALIDWTKSGPEGHFTIDFAAANRTYTVVGSGPQYYVKRVENLNLCEKHRLEIVLDPAAVLEGVVKADRFPLTGGKARAFMEDEAGNRLVSEETTVDPESGKFHFSNLEAGRYVLEVVADGYAVRQLHNVAVKDSPDVNDVTVELVEGATLRGQVLSRADHRPVIGASVVLGDSDVNGTILGPSPLASKAVTDGTGHFVLEHLSAGASLTLLVEHPDFATASVHVSLDEHELSPARLIELDRGATLSVSLRDEMGRRFNAVHRLVYTSAGELRISDEYAGKVVFERLPPGKTAVQAMFGTDVRSDLASLALSRDVQLAPGETRQITFSLAGGARIYGSVTGNAVGKSLNELEVSTASASNPNFRDRSTWVNGRARYSLSAVPAGDRLVYLRSEGVGNGFKITKRIHLEEGEDLELNFDVSQAGLEGRVVDTRQQPLVGAVIWAVPRSGDDLTPSDLKQKRTQTRVTETGDYSLVGLKSGAYFYSVELDGYGWEQGEVDVPDEKTMVHRDITLRPEGPLEVDVADRAGAAVPSASCVVHRADGTSLTPLRLRKELLPERRVFAGGRDGLYTVHVEAEGFFPVDGSATCQSGHTTQVPVTLRRKGTLRLKALNPQGLTLPALPLVLTDVETGRTVGSWIALGLVTSSTGAAVTDAAGELTLEGLPEGPFTLRAQGITARVTVVAATVTGPVVLQQVP